MSISLWVTIIVPVVCVILTGILTIYNKVTTPDTTKEHLRKLGSWFRSILGYFLITVQTVFLVRDVMSKEPLTRSAVLMIALLVGSIFFSMNSILDANIYRLIGSIIALQGKQIEKDHIHETLALPQEILDDPIDIMSRDKKPE